MPSTPRERREAARTRTAEILAGYYSSAAVRAGISEYCGGGGSEEPHSFTAAGMAGYGGRRRLREPEGAPVPTLRRSWTALLDDGADVCRSLADSGGTLLQLDVDYTNPEEPAEPYRRPESCFAALEPVHDVISDAFGEYGVHPLVLMTGRGYHYTARAPLGSAFHAALLELAGPAPAPAEQNERARRQALADRAHEGAGRLLEHLAHEVIRRLHRRAPVPVSLADLPPPGGGPFVCLDLTAYADPVAQRYSRCAFSSNQKASMQGLAPERPFVVCLPRGRTSLAGLLEAREDVRGAARLASLEHARVPDAPGGVVWVEEYRRSGLAAFHREFDRGPQIEPGAWPWTYEALDLRSLPGCIAVPFEFPNPSLLRPACLRTAALALWGLGWHPRSIAGLVRARYEKDHGWGTLWQRYAPAARAEYYVRLLCGAVADGLEDPRELTCATQLQRGLCERDRCNPDWHALFDSLGERLRLKTGPAS